MAKQKELQKSKTKFRRSAKWLKFRAFKKKEQGNKDAITGSPLRAGFQVHHMNQNEETYEDLSDPENFLALNRYTHKLLHYFLVYYKKDKTILKRLKTVLDRMITLSEEEEEEAEEEKESQTPAEKENVVETPGEKED